MSQVAHNKNEVFVSGLPKDVEYTLWTRLAGRDPQSVADALISKDGLVVNVLAG
jgi:hypothetical protein